MPFKNKIYDKDPIKTIDKKPDLQLRDIRNLTQQRDNKIFKKILDSDESVNI